MGADSIDTTIALSDSRSAGFLFVASTAFSAEFRTRARKDPRIRLVTLENLYAGTTLSL